MEVRLIAKEGKYALLKLPSGETRRVLIACMATIGQVGNVDQGNVSLGKAGRSRHLGRRPHNRGVSHESGGPPARRRRGEILRRTPPRHSLGPADPRFQDAQQSRTDRYIVTRRGREERIVGGLRGDQWVAR